MQRLSVRLLGGLLVVLAVLFIAEALIELWRSGVDASTLRYEPSAARALASTVSRAFNNLLAIVLSFVAIAIPITANMYTPKLVEIFFTDRVNLISLLFYAAMGAHAIYCQSVFVDGWTPDVHLFLLATSGVIGFVIVVPYYMYVLDFLNPSTIIRRVRERVTNEFGRIPSESPFSDARRSLDDRILQLGNVVLRAVDRSDRDVALEAIRALDDTMIAYAKIKPSLPEQWYRVERERFPGRSTEAIGQMHAERTWVEHKTLSQLYLAYEAALAKMPDAVSAISLINGRVGLRASAVSDLPVLRLSIRFFNTFVRAAIAKRDVHAVFDVLHEYRMLAIDLLATRSRHVVEIGRHFRYYAGLAKTAGLSFITELAAADFEAVVRSAYERDSTAAPQLFDEFTALCATGSGSRFVKAQAMLHAYLESLGREEECARLRRMIGEASIEDVQTATRDIEGTDDPMFWEVTDRQVNIDFVPLDERENVLRVLDDELRRRAGETS
jgi:hypothetical protein